VGLLYCQHPCQGFPNGSASFLLLLSLPTIAMFAPLGEWWQGLGNRCLHFTWSSRGSISLDGLGLEVRASLLQLDFNTHTPSYLATYTLSLSLSLSLSHTHTHTHTLSQTTHTQTHADAHAHAQTYIHIKTYIYADTFSHTFSLSLTHTHSLSLSLSSSLSLSRSLFFFVCR